jgi:hypothetical protein
MAANLASKTTTLSAINRGGIATLADGTCWHISTAEPFEAKSWKVGAEVVIKGHVWTAPGWQGISSRQQGLVGAAMCSAC